MLVVSLVSLSLSLSLLNGGTGEGSHDCKLPSVSETSRASQSDAAMMRSFNELLYRSLLISDWENR